MTSTIQSPIHSDSLADVLERVLDKGVVIAGDVVISLVGIELLSIKVRLLITTVDKAMEMGINWWEADPSLCAAARQAEAGRIEDHLSVDHDRQIAASTPDQASRFLAGAPLAAPAPTPVLEAGRPVDHDSALLAEALAQADRERQRLEVENREVRGRLAMLEKRISALGA